MHKKYFDIEVKDKKTVLQWLSDYTDLYLTMLNNRDRHLVLKDSSILKECQEKKHAFCQMFSKMLPNILSDIPNFASDDLAGVLSEKLF